MNKLLDFLMNDLFIPNFAFENELINVFEVLKLVKDDSEIRC